MSTTADGDNVNFGISNGVLTQMKDEREWLILIHCFNHRIELGLKAAFLSNPVFDEVEEFYIMIFYYLKNSGAVKAEVKQACESLDITHYTLPKIHGTRFVSHQRYIHLWPALITYFENSKATATASTKKAKIEGYLRKLISSRMSFTFAVVQDILEKLVPASKVFEGEGLMIHEVAASIHVTTEALNEMIDDFDAENVPINSNIIFFQRRSRKNRRKQVDSKT